MSSIRFREECYGYHSGQTDCTIFAIQDNKPIGKLDISYHKLNGRKEAYINMIEVLPTFQGQGIGRALIHQLVKNVPYEAVNWGLLLDDGSGLKKAMDKEFGTSYKPLEPEEEQESDDIYPEGTNMKISELREMVEFAVQQALLESAFEQYDEAAVVPGDDPIKEKIDQALTLAVQCADSLLKKTAGSSAREQAAQKVVELFSDVDLSGDKLIKVEEMMMKLLPAMAHRLGGDDRVKNVGISVVHSFLSALKQAQLSTQTHTASLTESKYHIPNFFTLLR